MDVWIGRLGRGIIGHTNPQILRRLSRAQIRKELWLLLLHLLGPLLVVLEDAIMALLEVLADLFRSLRVRHSEV